MRRIFDHFHAELSVATGYAIPRYPLWIALAESGRDPEELDEIDLVGFCDGPLDAFLRTRGLALSARARRGLRRRVRRFDPRRSPEDLFASLAD